MQTLTLPARLESIQALRGFAAVLVLLYHIKILQVFHITELNPPYLITELKRIEGLMLRGYSGVDLFFVISGFVMFYIAGDAKAGLLNATRFLKRRIIRLYPIWWVFCGILVLYYIFTIGAPVKPSTVPEGTPNWLFLLKSAALFPQAKEPILGVGWTLIHEMYFYLVFTALLFVPSQHRIKAITIWLLLTSTAFFFGPKEIIASGYFGLTGSLLSLEFIAGVFAASLILRRRIFMPKAILITAAILFLSGLVFYTELSQTQRLWGRVAIFALPFALMVYGAAALEVQNKLIIMRPLIWLGDVSYSLYLSHLLVIGVLIRIWHHLPFPPIGAEGGVDNLIYSVVTCLSCLFTAAAFYYLLERPVVRLLYRVAKT